MDRYELEKRVLSVFNVLLCQQLQAGGDYTRKNVSNWDSLKHIEIIFALEEELGVEFSEAELAGLDSVAKILDALSKK